MFVKYFLPSVADLPLRSVLSEEDAVKYQTDELKDHHPDALLDSKPFSVFRSTRTKNHNLVFRHRDWPSSILPSYLTITNPNERVALKHAGYRGVDSGLVFIVNSLVDVSKTDKYNDFTASEWRKFIAEKQKSNAGFLPDEPLAFFSFSEDKENKEIRDAKLKANKNKKKKKTTPSANERFEITVRIPPVKIAGCDGQRRLRGGNYLVIKLLRPQITGVFSLFFLSFFSRCSLFYPLARYRRNCFHTGAADDDGLCRRFRRGSINL
jgi:hypothetical protein